jgi:thymidylate synthase (FAD)
MKIIQPSATIIGCPRNKSEGIKLLKDVELITRLSHRSETLITDTSWEGILNSVVLMHGDLSVIEHRSVTVFVVCDRGISHEWVRHRLGAYTQESTRFVNYKKKFGEVDFIQPVGLTGRKLKLWKESVLQTESIYLRLLSEDVSAADPNDIEKALSPQIARSVLPNGLTTRMYVTYNLRMWRHFFIMRTTQETHPQMKQITIPLLVQFQERIPLLYQDIEPDTKQSESMKRLR